MAEGRNRDWLHDYYPLAWLPFHIRQPIAEKIDVPSPSGRLGFEMFASLLDILPEKISLIKARCGHQNFHYSPTLLLFEEYANKFSIQRIYLTLVEMNSCAADIIRQYLPDILRICTGMRFGHLSGRQNSEPLFCRCPNCTVPLRWPESMEYPRGYQFNTPRESTEESQTAHVTEQARNTRSMHTSYSHDAYQRPLYPQSQPVMSGHINGISTNNRATESEYVEPNSAAESHPVFSEPEDDSSICSCHACRCASDPEQTKVLTANSEQQNYDGPLSSLNRMMQDSHTQGAAQTCNIPENSDVNEKNAVVNENMCEDCEECRAKSDPEQTKVLKLFSDPKSWCRLHSEKSGHSVLQCEPESHRLSHQEKFPCSHDEKNCDCHKDCGNEETVLKRMDSCQREIGNHRANGDVSVRHCIYGCNCAENTSKEENQTISCDQRENNNTKHSDQPLTVYSRNSLEDRYSWHGEDNNQSRQSLSSSNSGSDPGSLCSKSSSSQSSSDPDRPVILITYGLGGDPVQSERNKAHMKEVLQLAKNLKKEKICIKIDMDDLSFNKRGWNRIDFLETSLQNAKYVIACISPEYAQDIRVSETASPHVSQLNTRYIYSYMRDEYYRNQSQNRRVIPVLFPNSGATYSQHVPSCMSSTSVYTFPKDINTIVDLIHRQQRD